jgi:hypothetical protein
MTEKTRKLICVFILMALVTSSVSIFIPKVSAQTTKISVEPSSIIDTTIDPGEAFTVNITVTNVTDLFGWQIKLRFSSAVLNCTGATVPTDNVFAGLSSSSPPPSIDNVAGSVLKLGVLVGVQPGVNVPNKGMFCQLSFLVKARGQTSLTLGDVGKFTYMLNSTGAKIPFTPEHGFFDNRLSTPAASAYVDPARIVDPTLTPSTGFTANITIAEATDLYQWNASLFYKSDILNITDVVEGPFLKTGGTTSFTVQIQNNYNATHGRLTTSCALVGAPAGVTGNGTLAVITFHVVGLGNTTLVLAQTALYDKAGTPLPFSTSDGYFDNMLLAKFYVIPPVLIDPTLLPPADFNITVAVDDVDGLYGYEFNLTYNARIITCIGILFNSPLGEPYFQPSFDVDNVAGFVWVKVDFYPPATPIQTTTNETLVTIFFRVKGMGSTVLDLTDTRMTDPEGQPIHHEAHDGFFATLIRDLTVTNVVPSTNQAYASWTVYINVTVLNKGNISETFDVKAYYELTNLIGTITVHDLDPNNETTITFAWNTTGVQPCHNYTISAEAIPVPFEINITDNVFIDGKVKIVLMGDLDHDGTVELQDFKIMSDAFGSYPGHPRWSPEADLNQDGTVDLMDFWTLSKNFGQTCLP